MPIAKSAAETEKPAYNISRTLTLLRGIVSTLVSRASQASNSPELKELTRQITIADAALQHDISVGLKLEVLTQKLSLLMEMSKDMFDRVEHHTQLDITSEKREFSALYKAWLVRIDTSERENIHDDKKTGLALYEDVNVRLDSYSEAIAEVQATVSYFGKTLQELESVFNREISPHQKKYEQFIAEYDAVKPDIDTRIAELDKLLGLQGKKVLAGRFEADAVNEEKAANYFRRGGIGVMIIAILVIVASYYELAEFDLSPSAAVVRIVFSLILSVPAAYLARESAKHRQRQYWLRQTALEIGAIDSYIATLPIEIQHKIKEETATKLFTPKPQEGFDKDSYPVNAQELLLKMIDVVGNKTQKAVEKKESKKDEDS